MSSTTLYRFSGVALLIGGILAIAGQLLLVTADPGTPLWIPGSWLSLAGTLLVILGFPGLYFKQADRAGLLGIIGFVISFAGFLFLVGIQTFDAFASFGFLLLTKQGEREIVSTPPVLKEART